MSRTVMITVCLVVALFAGRPANAATSTLTCTADIQGDLRATIDAAATGDTIVLPPNCVIRLTGAANDDADVSGDLDISANTAATTLTFKGGGVGSTIIDGGGNDRIFDINTGKTVTIQDMTLRNGDATKSTGTKDGGCIFFGGTALTLTNVQITGCKGASGGGVFDLGGTVTMTNVAITGNTATVDGGGFQADSIQDTLTNVTISGNHANGGGGGIHHNNGPMTLQNVTIANNTAGAAGGGGIFIEAGGAPTGKNLLIAGNTATGGGDPNCHGTFTAATNTMTNDKTGCTPTLSFTVANPNLQPLANNSGGTLVTLTHALLSDSPAVNAGGASGCPATDQHNATRASCDIGAFEMTQPNLAVSVNQTSYKAGDTLTIAGSAGGGPQVVDVFVVLIVPASAGLCDPGQLTLVFFQPGNSFFVICGADDPASFPSFLDSFSVPAAPVAGTVVSFANFGGVAPKGTYNAILAFTTPGAFAGGTLSGIVSLAQVTFIVE